ncbi:division plane positioning ATPase MipZ [Thalassospira sp.]|uniref:division plane positioning ATPase MipZ n=1 Tax=Thalassospira sp. TaxID=1912094 RepID=UPI0027367EDA|nr:division plane positioning ATPase MipZ [Thalassospira sp.]MDP2700091.1 division plane positioning ATPase MipZ [Thalassospira sp.]
MTGQPTDATGENTTATKPRKRAHVIVIGNEKGGSGKSTTAMHLVVSLLRMGFRVGSMDIDARQGTLTRYVENRVAFNAARKLSMPMPEHRSVPRSEIEDGTAAKLDERDRFTNALGELVMTCDFVILDCPGSDNYLSRLGHSCADTLVTPINDSYIDLDMLARVDSETLEIKGPSIYAEMVWDARKRRAAVDGGTIDWVVMRNRLSHLDARNKRDIADILDKLAERIRFRVAPGFGERVIYRELFLKGMTLLDLREKGTGISLSMSHMAARQEVRQLLEVIGFSPAEGEELPI